MSRVIYLKEQSRVSTYTSLVVPVAPREKKQKKKHVYQVMAKSSKPTNSVVIIFLSFCPKQHRNSSKNLLLSENTFLMIVQFILHNYPYYSLNLSYPSHCVKMMLLWTSAQVQSLKMGATKEKKQSFWILYACICSVLWWFCQLQSWHN